jgi:phytoene dehydrogenase-like protein
MSSEEKKKEHVLIIGAGHNGLVSACILARAGYSVEVHEKRDIFGGMCVTEELIEGFKFQPAASCYGMLRREIVEEFKLKEKGLSTYFAEEELVFFSDKTYIHRFPQKDLVNYDLIKHSPEDMFHIDQFLNEVLRAADILAPYLMKPPIQLDTIEELFQRESFKYLKQPFETSVYETLSGFIINDKLLAEQMINGIGDPFAKGSMYAFIFAHTALTNNRRGGWGYVKGGMGAVADSLVKTAKELGVKLFKGSAVKEILIDHNNAYGIKLESGKDVYADIIISNCTPKHTFINLVASSHLKTPFLSAVSNVDSAGNGAKIHFTLNKLPITKPWSGSRALGRYIMVESMSEMRNIYSKYRNQEIPNRNILFITIPSFYDTTLAPNGKHGMSVELLFIPYSLRSGSWNREKRQALMEYTVTQISNYLEDFAGCIEKSLCIDPYTFSKRYSADENGHFHIAMTTEQIFEKRPLKGWSNYSTPINNLFLCGAGTHPGGTVSGANGYICAYEILKNHFHN